MRRNFGEKPWFYPLPVLIIGTYDENGGLSMEKFKPPVFGHATYNYLKVDGVAGKVLKYVERKSHGYI